MEDLKTIIYEKLKLTKNIKSDSENIDVSNVEIAYQIVCCFGALNLKEQKSCLASVENCFKNHKNPKTLFNSRSVIYQIVNKWFCAVMMQWDEAEEILRNAIIERRFVPEIEMQINAYIYKIYNKKIGNRWSGHFSIEDIKSGCEHYLEKYNIKFDERS